MWSRSWGLLRVSLGLLSLRISFSLLILVASGPSSCRRYTSRRKIWLLWIRLFSKHYYIISIEIYWYGQIFSSYVFLDIFNSNFSMITVNNNNISDLTGIRLDMMHAFFVAFNYKHSILNEWSIPPDFPTYITRYFYKYTSSELFCLKSGSLSEKCIFLHFY